MCFIVKGKVMVCFLLLLLMIKIFLMYYGIGFNVCLCVKMGFLVGVIDFVWIIYFFVLMILIMFLMVRFLLFGYYCV